MMNTYTQPNKYNESHHTYKTKTNKEHKFYRGFSKCLRPLLVISREISLEEKKTTLLTMNPLVFVNP